MTLRVPLRDRDTDELTMIAFQILEALETDAGCRKLHLAHRLENVACTLEGEETSAC